MSQDSIGVVTTGRRKLQEWKTTQKQNLSRKSRGTLTVKWAGARDKIFSPSGRGRTFFLTSLFIELIDDAFQFYWQVRIQTYCRGWCRIQNGFEYYARTFPTERKRTCRHLVEYRS